MRSSSGASVTIALLLALPAMAAVPQPAAFGVSSDPTQADGKTFDYIVVGGGLTGLTVANRLSELADKRVLVIEAGNDDRTDPNVYDINRCAAFLSCYCCRVALDIL